MNALLIVALVAAGGAVMLHIFIFALETLFWQSSLARKTFGLSEEQAAATKEMAANQGVYNLLLALEALTGIVAVSAGQRLAGLVLIAAGCGSMLVAASFLFATAPDKRTAALKQGILPALTIIVLIIHTIL